MYCREVDITGLALGGRQHRRSGSTVWWLSCMGGRTNRRESQCAAAAVTAACIGEWAGSTGQHLSSRCQIAWSIARYGRTVRSPSDFVDERANGRSKDRARNECFVRKRPHMVGHKQMNIRRARSDVIPQAWRAWGLGGWLQSHDLVETGNLWLRRRPTLLN